MKSAYELAMERLNKSAPVAKLTDDQKKQISELEAKYKAKIAEREIFLKDALKAAAAKGDAESYVQLEKELVSERKSLQAKLEEEKEAVRNAKG